MTRRYYFLGGTDELRGFVWAGGSEGQTCPRHNEQNCSYDTKLVKSGFSTGRSKLATGRLKFATGRAKFSQGEQNPLQSKHMLLVAVWGLPVVTRIFSYHVKDSKCISGM